MRVVNVATRDVYFTLEISLKEIMMLKNMLSKSTIEMDSSNPADVEANTFLVNEFYPFLETIAEKGESYAS